MMEIPFNKLFLTGKETEYIAQALASGKISGDGPFTGKCHSFFEERYGFQKCLLTPSCTDALEMAAILIDIKQEDEVIAPSFTFESTVNPFVLRGATIVFADSEGTSPNIDAEKIEELITPRTKAIIAVHYAGIACDMDRIMEVADKHNLYVIEDAAHSIDSYYKGRPLGSIGHLGTFSFHGSKNVTSGEGGMLVINDKSFNERAEIIREKGTNRSKFLRGEIDKYTWVDVGSSFLPSDVTAAFLYAQLESIDEIQGKRKAISDKYREGLSELKSKGLITLPEVGEGKTDNAHMFFLTTKDHVVRTALIDFLKQRSIQAVFHYQSLHKSPYFRQQHDNQPLKNSERYSDCLLRLPLYSDMTLDLVEQVTESVRQFFLKTTHP